MNIEFIQMKYAAVDILEKRAEISKRLIAASDIIHDVTLNQIAVADLKLLFQLYNEVFFENRWDTVFHGRLKFSLSRRLTKSAGKTLCPKNIERLKPEEVVIEIRMGLDFFFRYDEIAADKTVSGIVTQSALEAFQIVFEHELCHMIELVYFHHSSCRGKRFKTLARNIFGHTASYHQLPTGRAIAQEKYGFKLGDKVSFQFEDQVLTGLLANVNKRATVMVRDKKGSFVDQQGHRYSKYYVSVKALSNASIAR